MSWPGLLAKRPRNPNSETPAQGLDIKQGPESVAIIQGAVPLSLETEPQQYVLLGIEKDVHFYICYYSYTHSLDKHNSKKRHELCLES